MTLPKGTPRPCKGCGKEINRLKFCGADCRGHWYQHIRPRLQGALPREIAIAKWRAEYRKHADKPCQQCGRTFRPRSSKKDQISIFCSNECRIESKRLYASRKEAKAVHRRKRGQLTMAEWREKQAAERQPIINPCQDCGQPVGKWAHRCEACRDRQRLIIKQGPAARAARAKSRARYRARLQSARIETFDPYEIFERDKWACYICGVDTPMALRGTNEANAPELDHVIPLAAGGAHSRANTACSCRRCNNAKSDRLLPDMRAAA